MREPIRDNPPPRVLKVSGADIELGNFVVRSDDPGCSCREASRALLAEIKGLPRRELYRYNSQPTNWQSVVYGARPVGGGALHQGCSFDDHDLPQDWGRKFLAENGGCVYIDLDHLELCIPEVTNAWDHVAATHAMYRIARSALLSANEKQRGDSKIQALVNNSDGQGNSYGSPISFLLTRRSFENIFSRKSVDLPYLASFQVSSLIYTGQGKVGSENGSLQAAYQLSQRADFFESLTSLPTTYRRGIVNSRDEALCGATGYTMQPDSYARLHSIFFDSTLAQGSTLLKVGVMQIILAMIEAEQRNASLVLDDPVEAVVQISQDVELKNCVPLASGKRLTAIELQELFLQDARRFADEVGFDGIVPRASEILDLWEDTLAKLRAGDVHLLAPRLDWVLKLMTLERTLDRRPQLNWGSPELKVLDLVYSSLDDDGLFWSYQKTGFTEVFVDDQRIEELTETPPDDTRAWTRAMLLRCAGDDVIDTVDWDVISFRLRGPRYWPVTRKISLGTPLALTRADSESIFRRCENLAEVLDSINVASCQPITEDGTDSSMSACQPRESIH